MLEAPNGLRGTLAALTRIGVVTAYLDGPEHAWGVSAGRQHEAAFYRNSIVHFFVNRAIVELIGLAIVEEEYEDLATATWNEALRLRDTLKFEFFFPSKAQFADEIRDEAAMIDSDWEAIASNRARVRDKLGISELFLAHRVVGPYSQAYVVVADRLAARDPGMPLMEKEFVRECMGAARQYRAQQRIWSSEAMSREFFQNGLRLAANRGLLEEGGEDVAERRRAFADEMHILLRRVRTIRDLALLDLDSAMRWTQR